MKTGLKTFVRAISPFTKAGKPAEASGPPQKTDVSDFNWDLSRVDMVVLLSNFYNVYNPERVRSVHEILHQYEGEEILMLQQLCERYNLCEPDMQTFLDNALLGRKDRFGNWMKKKSEGSVTTDLDSNKDNTSVEGTKERPRSGYAGFVWDLSSVDLPKALKHLYRKHNPQKTPNVASLGNKTENEKILLLQQLCKRHNLTQADMQVILDGARIKDETSSQHSNERSVSKSRQGSRSRGQRGGDSSAAASDDGSQSEQQTLRKSVAGSSVASALFSSLHRQSSRQSIAEHDDSDRRSVEGSANPTDSNNKVITGAAPQRGGSLPFWPNSFTPSAAATAAASSTPPPPPPPPAVFNASPASSRPPPPGRSMSAPQQQQQATSPGSVASSVTSSVTASSRYVDGAVEKATSRHSPSPAPSVASLSRSGSLGYSASSSGSLRAAGGYGSNAQEATQEERREAEASVAGSRNTAVSRSNSRVGAASTAGSYAGTTNRSTEGARAAELLDLQRELSEARLQVVGVKKENQALLKALQDSKQRQTDAESTVSELSHHQAHLEQVPELLAEISRLNVTLKQQEEREAALKRQYSQLKQQVQNMHEQVAMIEQQRDDAQGDARDVLRLVDIMSASPAGIKSVLEAYLKQLGEATGSVPVKFGIGTDGRQIPISERIALALKIKREQQLQRQGETKKPLRATIDTTTEDAENPSARNTPSKTRSNGKALERQQENYQKFKTSLSEQQKTKKLHKAKQTQEDEERSSDAALSDFDDEAGELDETTARDFLDYASPDVRKMKSSSRAAEKKKQKGGDDNNNFGQAGQAAQGEVQASLASDIATDWIECLDPRSKRKYYYSAALKKSTWTKPVGFSSTSSSSRGGASAGSPVGQSAPLLSSMGVTMPSRYNSPNLSMHMTGRQQQPLSSSTTSPAPAASYSSFSSGSAGAQRMTADELNGQSDSLAGKNANNPLSLAHPFRGGNNTNGSSLRSASPFSTNSHTSAASADFSHLFTSNSRSESKNNAYNSRSSSPAVSVNSSVRSASPSIRTGAAQQQQHQPSPGRVAAGSSAQDWVTAVDPNSNRKYWYNRKTKVSTWRQPAELII